MGTTTPALHLDDIGQIALTVTDLNEAKSFYRDTLGMPFLFDAGPMAFFQCGPIRLLIGVCEPPPATSPASTATSPGSGAILYFRVPNIDTATAVLKEKGVSFLQEPRLVARMKSHDLWLAFLKDPAGNTLALMSEVPRA